ncbi:unnamed protein product, partial [Linum tenue]
NSSSPYSPLSSFTHTLFNSISPFTSFPTFSPWETFTSSSPPSPYSQPPQPSRQTPPWPTSSPRPSSTASRTKHPTAAPGRTSTHVRPFCKPQTPTPTSATEDLSPVRSAKSRPSSPTSPTKPEVHILSYDTTGMCYVEEINRATYCDPSQYPCAPGKKYYGRGPLQLTWNYNYAVCGRANNFNGVGDPDVVARDPVLAWKTALWFWMTNVRPVLPQGFGATIRKINGIECNGGNAPAVRARVSYYNSYCQKFGIQPEANTSC